MKPHSTWNCNALGNIFLGAVNGYYLSYPADLIDFFEKLLSANQTISADIFLIHGGHHPFNPQQSTKKARSHNNGEHDEYRLGLSPQGLNILP